MFIMEYLAKNANEKKKQKNYPKFLTRVNILM